MSNVSEDTSELHEFLMEQNHSRNNNHQAENMNVHEIPNFQRNQTDNTFAQIDYESQGEILLNSKEDNKPAENLELTNFKLQNNTRSEDSDDFLFQQDVVKYKQHQPRTLERQMRTETNTSEMSPQRKTRKTPLVLKTTLSSQPSTSNMQRQQFTDRQTRKFPLVSHAVDDDSAVETEEIQSEAKEKDYQTKYNEGRNSRSKEGNEMKWSELPSSQYNQKVIGPFKIEDAGAKNSTQKSDRIENAQVKNWAIFCQNIHYLERNKKTNQKDQQHQTKKETAKAFDAAQIALIKCKAIKIKIIKIIMILAIMKCFTVRKLLCVSLVNYQFKFLIFLFVRIQIVLNVISNV